MSNFLPKHVLDKYIFIKGDEKYCQQELSKHIAVDQLGLYGNKTIKYDKKTLLEIEKKYFKDIEIKEDEKPTEEKKE
jgi:hypothetical protein